MSIRNLHIQNFVLISSLDIEFPEGLIVITGPTGAGKSILIGALGLLLGRKADASVISGDADNCVVEAQFDIQSPALEAFAAENDFEYENGSFIVRRTVARSGRSRAFINDTPVTLPVLEEFGAMMVDIHSQHDTRLLTSKSYQLSILDAYAGNSSLLDECAGAFGRCRSLSRSMADLQARLDASNAEADYNSALYAQLSDAHLQEGEIESLEKEQLQLANALQIKELLSSCMALNDGSDDSEGIEASLVSVHRNLEKLSQYLGGYNEFAARLESARLEIKDILSEVEASSDAISDDPQRLEWIDDRLSLLYGLLKRHGAADETELIAKRDALKDLVFGSEALASQLEDLKKEYAEAETAFDALCTDLHSRRLDACQGFCANIRESLAFMELDKAAFEIEITAAAPGEYGSDQVCFMFNAAGGKTVPMAKCASGGELSRIMLALKQLMCRFMAMPVMVFDEIDTGVSGSVADKMGSVICQMGKTMQVFAITHLPQVAAKGQAHYLVEKVLSEGAAESTIKKLSAEQRVMEIARMLSGASLSQAAIDNARALLSD